MIVATDRCPPYTAIDFKLRSAAIQNDTAV